MCLTFDVCNFNSLPYAASSMVWHTVTSRVALSTRRRCYGGGGKAINHPTPGGGPDRKAR